MNTTVHETVIQSEQGSLFVQHTRLVDGQPTVMFVHGLGDSGLCFREAFAAPGFERCNVIVPDLPGHGRSSCAADCDYGLDAQVRRLWAVVDESDLTRVCLVGHSLGGNIATAMAASDERFRVNGLVNVEGDLTPHDIFISNQAVSADDRGDLERWFHEDFLEALVLNKWGRKRISSRRYYASLWFCHLDAFLANAREICEKGGSLPGREESEFGARFRKLNIPKMYCWGAASLSVKTRQFLEAAGIPNQRFDRAGHAVMVDQPQEFYAFLRGFVEGLDWARGAPA